MIAAVVLAAGSSKRFGTNKLLHELKGKSVLRRSLDAIPLSEFRKIAVVVPPGNELEQAISRDFTRIVNEDAERGIGTSIALGTRLFENHVKGIMFLLGDQPLIKKETIERLAHVFNEGPEHIVACSVDGVVRNPIIFPSKLFKELMDLRGDKGARSIAETHRDCLIKLETDPQSLLDVDTVGDTKEIENLIEE